MSELPKKKFIRVSDVPKIYSIGRDKIYRWQKENPPRIKIYKLDGCALLKVSDLDRIIEETAA